MLEWEQENNKLYVHVVKYDFFSHTFSRPQENAIEGTYTYSTHMETNELKYAECLHDEVFLNFGK